MWSYCETMSALNMKFRKATARQQEIQLNATLKQLQEARTLNDQLMRERDDSEEELKKLMDKNTVLRSDLKLVPEKSVALITKFNKESAPVRLGNFEVPRWAPTRARPLEMRPDPKPIADLNGHFLPGAPRGTSKFSGHYTGTWDLPRKITRKVAAELSQQPPHGRFTDWLNLRVQRPKAIPPAERLRQAKKVKKAGLAPAQPEKPFKDIDGNHTEGGQKDSDAKTDNGEDNEENDDPLDLNKTLEPVDEGGNGPYVPGVLTDPDKRHESYDFLVKEAVEDLHGPQENKTDKFWRKVAENVKDEDHKTMKYHQSAPKLPAVNVSQNFHFAKKMHVGNLEHQPLPDTLGYRNMTKIAEHRDSDIIVKPYAIGWKGYGASGPTCCTKMRVHRPKTCDPQKGDADTDDAQQRPFTSAPGLGQNKKKMSLMDLAICWDFRPNDPKFEPKPPKHIDGSNGSKAPAVFTMVHTPKELQEESIKTGHSNPLFNENRFVENDIGRHPVPFFEKDMTKVKRKDSCEVQHCPQHNGHVRETRLSSSSRRSSAQMPAKSRCDGIHGCGTPSDTSRKSSQRQSDNKTEKTRIVKDAWNDNNNNNGDQRKTNNNDVNRNRNSLESYEKTPLAQGKLHQSTPDDSTLSRRSTKEGNMPNFNGKHKTCLSCNGVKIQQDTKQKEDYKFAFKAGNPNSVQSGSVSQDSKGCIKIPKMRHPYTKKTYTIPTLTPPFSIWRDANATGYPEHWRLASVYQHAYNKPPEQRRKPLISSVYQ